jgi:hypothetical protein
VEEPARLVCPQCDLVYRLKKVTPGRAHYCKSCGTELRNPDGSDPVPAATATAGAGASDLSRLPKLIEQLTARLDELTASVESHEDESEESHEGDEQEAAPSPTDTLLAAVAQLKEEMTRANGELDGKLQFLADDIAGRLATAPAPAAEKTTFEVDIDELADRLVAGVSGRGPVYDAETGTAVDALARLADQLVSEQNANTARLDELAGEIHGAVANIAKLEEWQTELPDRVADEIGATVESRVVGPISGALARQAPSILSDLQDSKLVDIVSRSVREAQRPLLREILAGGRNGIPVWLFASVLLPLLLILGYLFLPGEMGGRGAAAVPPEIADALLRIEAAGVPLSPDAEERLLGIEEAVLDIHGKALEHVRNAATLEEEVKNLRRLLEERDGIIAEYTTTLERQTRRLQAYEFRLVQLGVKPDAVAGE